MSQDVNLNYNIKIVENAQRKLDMINESTLKVIDTQLKMKRSLAATESVTKSYSESLNMTAKAQNEHVKSVEKAEKANVSFVDKIKNVINIVKTAITKFKDFIQWIIELSQVISTLNLFKLGVMAKLFLAFLRFRGYGKLADFLKPLVEFILKIAQKIKDLSKELGLLSEQLGFVEYAAASTLGTITGFFRGIVVQGALFTALVTLDNTFNLINKTIVRTDAKILDLVSKSILLNKQYKNNIKTFKLFGLDLTNFASKTVTTFARGLLKMRDGLTSVARVLREFRSFGQVARLTLESLGAVLKGTLQDTARATSTFLKAETGIVGLATKAAIATASFATLGKILFESEGTLGKFAGVVLLGVAAALGGIVAIMKVFLDLIGDVIYKVGTLLVQANQKAAATMVEAESATFAFERTIANFNIETSGAIGSVESWNKTVEELRATTSISRRELQLMSTQVVEVGTRLGFNEKQMRKIIGVSIDYAKANKKDVLDSLNAVVGGLTGQGQAARNMGIFLDETTVSMLNFGKNSKKSLKSLNEQQKAQLRYNALLKQYHPIAGTAVAATTTLAERQKLLKSTQEDLLSVFGKGSEIIENQVNIPLEILFSIIKKLPKEIIQVSGFFSGLVGRLLQLIGIIVKTVFTVSLLAGAFKTLNFILGTDTLKRITNVTLPIFRKSLVEIIKSMGVLNVDLYSLQGVAKTSFSILTKSTLNAVKAMLGLDAATKLTGKTFAIGFFKRIKQGIQAVNIALAKILLNPVFLKITAITVGVYLLVRAFQAINEETGVFTRIYESFKETGFWDLIVNAVKKIGEIFSQVIEVSVLGVALGLVRIAELSVAIYNTTVDVAEWIVNAIPKGINFIIKKFSSLLDYAQKFLGFGNLYADTLEKTLVPLEVQEVKFKNNIELQNKLTRLGDKFSKKMFDAANGTSKVVDEFGEGTKELSNWERVIKAFSDFNIDAVSEAFKKIKITDLKEGFKGVGDILINEFKKAYATLKPAFEEASKNIGKIFEKKGVAGTLIASVAGGSGGARSLVNSIADGVGAAFGPAGTAFSEAFKFLSMSTEDFRNAIDGFINTIVMLPQTLAENAGYLIRRIVQAIPEIIDALVESLPILMEEIAELLKDPEFWRSMMRAIVSLFLFYLTGGLVTRIDQIMKPVDEIFKAFTSTLSGIGNIFKSAADIFNDTVNLFIDPINKLINAIDNVSGGVIGGAGGFLGDVIGGVGDVIGDVGGVFGWSSGGDVPNSGRYAGDRFGPVMLDRGESVITGKTTDRLKAFLDRQERSGNNGSQQPIYINLQVGEKELAQVLVDLKEKGFRTA